MLRHVKTGHYPNPLGKSNPAAAGHEDLSGRLGGSPEYSVSVIDYNQPAARTKRISLRGAHSHVHSGISGGSKGAVETAAHDSIITSGRTSPGSKLSSSTGASISTRLAAKDMSISFGTRHVTMKPGLISEEDDDEQFDFEAAIIRFEKYVDEHPDFITAVYMLLCAASDCDDSSDDERAGSETTGNDDVDGDDDIY